MARYVWSDGMGRVSLTMTMTQARSCSGPGQQIDNARALVLELGLQISEMDETKIRAVLREYGFDEESLNDSDNLARLIWIAACDIKEAPARFTV